MRLTLCGFFLGSVMLACPAVADGANLAHQSNVAVSMERGVRVWRPIDTDGDEAPASTTPAGSTAPGVGGTDYNLNSDGRVYGLGYGYGYGYGGRGRFANHRQGEKVRVNGVLPFARPQARVPINAPRMRLRGPVPVHHASDHRMGHGGHPMGHGGRHGHH